MQNIVQFERERRQLPFLSELPSELEKIWRIEQNMTDHLRKVVLDLELMLRRIEISSQQLPPVWLAIQPQIDRIRVQLRDARQALLQPSPIEAILL